MGRKIKKTKLQVEVEILTRTHRFKGLKKMINSHDIETVKLAIAIIESKKKFSNLAKDLSECVEAEESSDRIPFHIFNFINDDNDYSKLVDQESVPEDYRCARKVW